MPNKDSFPMFKLKELSQQDYNNYLHDCFVRCKLPTSDDEVSWKYVKCVAGEGYNAFALITAFDGKSTKEYPIKEVEFEFSFPVTGMYDFREGVLQFARVPKRQWVRGLYHSNAVFHSPLAQFPVFILPSDVRKHNTWSWGCHNLNQVFLERANPNPKKAIEAIWKEKSLMRVMNRQISISQGLMSDNPTIWMLMSPIGELVGKKKIELYDDSFAPEVSDLVTPLGMEVKVNTNGGKVHETAVA